MGLFDWWRRKPDAIPPMGRYLPVTEDRDEQYDVLPAALRPWAEDQLRLQAAHYASRPGPYPLPAIPGGGIRALAIPIEAAIAALSAVLDRFDGVLPPGNVPSTGPAAFGPSPLTAVILGHDRDGLLADIELILHGNRRDEEMALLRGLATLPARDGLIVVDWLEGRIAQLDDAADLDAFLAV